MTALQRRQASTAARLPRVAGKPVLRRSFVENFLACGTWANGESEDAAFGTYVHECLARYVNTCRAHREETRLVDVERIVRETFFHRARGISPVRISEAMRMVEKFAREWPAELRTLLSIERTLAVDIGWAVLTGTVDREDRMDEDDRDDPPRVIRLRDYKTHWGVADHTFQMRFYAQLRFLQEDARDLEEVQAQIIHPRLNIDPVEDFYYRGELDEWWQEEVLKPLQARWAERRRLRPTGGVACQYCAKRLTCGAAIGPAAVAPNTIEEYTTYFGETLRLDAVLEERRRVHRLFFRDREPAVLLGYEAGYLLPKNGSEEVVVADGREEDLVAEMNAIQPGAGDLIRRTGIEPKLINAAWWDHLVDKGLLARVPKKPKPGWRKHIVKGVAEPALTVLEGGADE